MKKLKDWHKKNYLNIYKKFLKIIGYTKNTSRNLFGLFKFALYMIMTILFINLITLFFRDSSFGEWGDFFGGVLNPILTFLTFMGLLITIIIQQKELKESRNEFKGQKEALEKQQIEMTIQSFDNKFFQMLNSFNNITESLAISGLTTGKDVFKEHISVLKQEIRYSYDEDLSKDKTYSNKIIYFINVFNDFNNTYDTTFKYYFINLYQLIKFIDEDIPYKGEERIRKAKKYTNIIRAQLSKNELVLLAYNAIGIIEFCGEDYKKLIEKYSFFEHLKYDDFNNDSYILSIVNSILIQYDTNAFGNNDNIKKQIENISKDFEEPIYQKTLSKADKEEIIKLF